jgi:hypothetical protein
MINSQKNDLMEDVRSMRGPIFRQFLNITYFKAGITNNLQKEEHQTQRIQNSIIQQIENLPECQDINKNGVKYKQ